MTEAIVHRLEPVEVEVAHPQRGAVTTSAREGLIEAVAQQPPVRDARQQIEVRDAIELGFMRLQPAHVGEDADVVEEPPPVVLDGDDGQRLDVHLARLSPVPQLALPGARRRDREPHFLVEFAALTPRTEEAGVSAEHLLPRVAGEPDEGRVDVDDVVVGVADQNALLARGKHARRQADPIVGRSLLGNVTGGGEDEILGGARVPLEPPVAAILAPVPVAEALHRLALAQPRHLDPGHFEILPVHEVEKRRPFKLTQGVAEDLDPQRVELAEAPVEVGDAEELEGRVEVAVQLRSLRSQRLLRQTACVVSDLVAEDQRRMIKEDGQHGPERRRADVQVLDLRDADELGAHHERETPRRRPGDRSGRQQRARRFDPMLDELMPEGHLGDQRIIDGLDDAGIAGEVCVAQLGPDPVVELDVSATDGLADADEHGPNHLLEARHRVDAPHEANDELEVRLVLGQLADAALEPRDLAGRRPPSHRAEGALDRSPHARVLGCSHRNEVIPVRAIKRMPPGPPGLASAGVRPPQGVHGVARAGRNHAELAHECTGRGLPPE